MRGPTPKPLLMDSDSRTATAGQQQRDSNSWGGWADNSLSRSLTGWAAGQGAKTRRRDLGRSGTRRRTGRLQRGAPGTRGQTAAGPEGGPRPRGRQPGRWRPGAVNAAQRREGTQRWRGGANPASRGTVGRVWWCPWGPADEGEVQSGANGCPGGPRRVPPGGPGWPGA
jgi:hypothetical protein